MVVHRVLFTKVLPPSQSVYSLVHRPNSIEDLVRKLLLHRIIVSSLTVTSLFATTCQQKPGPSRRQPSSQP